MRARPPRLRAQYLIPRSTYISPLHSRILVQHQSPINTQQQVRTIKSIQKPAPQASRYNEGQGLPILESSPAAALERRRIADSLPLRTGALGTKKGMTAVYDTETGKRTPCTVIQLDQVQVIAHKTFDQHGYYAVCVGSGWRRPKNIGRAMMGVFANTKVTQPDGSITGLPPKKDIREFRVRDEKGLLPLGECITPKWFQIGQYVDVRANTKGKGFAGGMKKWGWGGQPASHGVSLTHRSMGSAGGSQGSGSRVIPGKKMAGRMGNHQHTVQNLKIMMVDDANGIVLVHGAIAGPRGSLVKIQDAVKKPWPIIPTESLIQPDAAVAQLEAE